MPAPRSSLLLPLACLSAVVAVFVGSAMRWQFTGWELPLGEFTLWRSAHSHLGYYGLLFPLMWAAWRQLGQAHPGWILLSAYALAVGASFVGFATQGYGLSAIVASTVVLCVWLVSAWQVRRGAGWLASVGPAILLGAVCIPPVAVLTSRDPALAQALVQGFLSVLLLGAVLPSGFQLIGMRAPRPWFWLLGVALTGAFVGPVPHPVLGIGPVLLAWLLGVSAWRTPGSWVRRAGWLAISGALLLLGLGLLPATRPVMIGGFHFLVLGPVLWSLSIRLWPSEPPPWAEAVYLGVMSTMGGSVVLQQWWPGQNMALIAAYSSSLAGAVVSLAGASVAGLWMFGGNDTGVVGHPAPSDFKDR